MILGILKKNNALALYIYIYMYNFFYGVLSRPIYMLNNKNNDSGASVSVAGLHLFS